MKTKRQSNVTVIMLSVVALVLATPIAAMPRQSNTKLVFATVVTNQAQERSAAMLIDSIRTFAGKYAQAPIYVVVDDPTALPCKGLAERGAIIIPLEMDPAARGYLFAEKVYAAAQVEKTVAQFAQTLVWMDPETIVLKPPRALDLDAGIAVALRPVFLVNAVGLAPEAPIDAFWEGIFKATGVNPEIVPIVTAAIKGEKIRAYYNCGVIAYAPRRGICQEWARTFTILVKDQAFQKATCSDNTHKIFLHQAVLSALVIKKTKATERRELPWDTGYPFHLHSQIPVAKQAKDLDDLTVVFLEDIMDQRPDWLSIVGIKEPLRTWLIKARREQLRVWDNLYREEGACNTYLALTPEGSVVIDPGGATDPNDWLLAMSKENPLKAILLTHGHEDHRAGIGLWKGELDIPVIAQREIVEYISYRDRLAGFFATRDAAQTGQTLAVPSDKPTPVEATVLFGDTYSITIGGITFEFTHTGGETPDTSVIWCPQLQAVFTGDNFYTSFPNLYTLRGTKPRWALDYVKALDTALAHSPEFLLPGHGEPIVGTEQVREKLTEYRDAILYIHDAVVKGMNDGKDVYTLMREITLPSSFKVGQFYGRVSWSVRGIYEAYAGWFDGNPANMYDQPPTAGEIELVKLAGGADAVVARAKELVQAGELVQALRLVDVALATQPGHTEALQMRMEVLRALRATSRNGIEKRWLDHAIRQTSKKMQP